MIGIAVAVAITGWVLIRSHADWRNPSVGTAVFLGGVFLLFLGGTWVGSTVMVLVMSKA